MTTSWILENYYAAQQDRLLNQFDRAITVLRTALDERYKTAETDAILEAARREYERLIPHIPYIGGSDNPLTEKLVMSAWFLAFYRAMKARGTSTGQIGSLIRRMYIVWLKRYPDWVWRLKGWWHFTQQYTDRLVVRALRSQQRRYPGDWVFTVSPGNGTECDYQVNYTACAICKFFHAQGASELIPYICSLDHLLHHMLGIKFVRHGTLAQGASHCDFRLKKS